MTSGSSMQAITLSSPPHFGQVSIKRELLSGMHHLAGKAIERNISEGVRAPQIVTPVHFPTFF